MICLVAGGAAFQVPAGRLSDSMDRRVVMLGLVGLGSFAAAVAWVSDHPAALYGAVFVLGGTANSIYPLCLSHANDRFPGQFLQVGTVILLMNAAGAVIGPTLGSFAMTFPESGGFFAFASLGMLLTGMWLTYCIRRHVQIPESLVPFVYTAKSSQALFELDPRSADGEPAHDHVSSAVAEGGEA